MATTTTANSWVVLAPGQHNLTLYLPQYTLPLHLHRPHVSTFQLGVTIYHSACTAHSNVNSPSGAVWCGIAKTAQGNQHSVSLGKRTAQTVSDSGTSTYCNIVFTVILYIILHDFLPPLSLLSLHFLTLFSPSPFSLSYSLTIPTTLPSSLSPFYYPRYIHPPPSLPSTIPAIFTLLPLSLLLSPLYSPSSLSPFYYPRYIHPPPSLHPHYIHPLPSISHASA